MIQPVQRVLVAVKDIRASHAATLRKAAALARSLGAKLELFHAITEPVPVDGLLFANMGLEKFEADARRRVLRKLESLAIPLRRGGLAVTVAAEWDYPAHEAVIRHAQQTKASLIVAQRHTGRHIAPWFLRYSDWELLRQSPVPVLLVKKSRAYQAPKVLAAIDPEHAFDKTASLDTAILQLASRIATATRGQMHAVHTYVPSLMGMSPAELSAPDATARITTHAAGLALAGFDKALRSARLGQLGPKRRHVLVGHAVDAIPALAGELGCDLVVMGAISRSGLKRLAFGNTAEALLDNLPCDLLIVKPPAFAHRVARRARGPQRVLVGTPSASL